MNVTENFGDTWWAHLWNSHKTLKLKDDIFRYFRYFVSYIKDQEFGIYLYKNLSEYQKEDYFVICTFSTKNTKLTPLEATAQEYNKSGYGYRGLATIEELFDAENPLVDCNNCLTIDIEVNAF